METFSSESALGSHGPDVKLAQEWLTLHGFSTVVDGAFGPATAHALRLFQAGRGLPVTNRIDPPTQAALLAPLHAAMAPLNGVPELRPLLRALARQHLAQHPREVGGENRGPWVRLYMNGIEGKAWPWCAGFATFLLREAAKTLHLTAPHPYAFGCDFLAGAAQQAGRFLRGHSDRIRPGYLFLVRKTPDHWQHIGIVEAIDGDTIVTIEGNTNDSGSPEGYEVCRRYRSKRDKDYLVV